MKTPTVLALALLFSLGCDKKDDAAKKVDDAKELADKAKAAADKAKTDVEKAKTAADKVADSAKASPKAALAELKPTKDSKVSGKVLLATNAEGKIVVTAEVTGLTPGDHGFHIHEKGDCSSPDGKSAGGHFNPKKVDHGSPTGDTHHSGDLGNLTADKDGVAKKTIVVDFISLGDGDTSAIGKAFIVHEKADDMKTQPTGAAGARLACGVINAAK